MFSPEEQLRNRILRELALAGFGHSLPYHHHRASDLGDEYDQYDDDMHTTGRFRPLSSAFLSHGSSSSSFGLYGQPDIDNMSYEQLLELGDRIGQVKEKGMAAEQLSVLPTWRWKGSTTVKQESASDEKNEKKGEGGDEDAKCSICLTEYDIGEEIKRLPCMRQNTVRATVGRAAVAVWLALTHAHPHSC